MRPASKSSCYGESFERYEGSGLRRRVVSFRPTVLGGGSTWSPTFFLKAEVAEPLCLQVQSPPSSLSSWTGNPLHIIEPISSS
jgi:hypothetical protein